MKAIIIFTAALAILFCACSKPEPASEKKGTEIANDTTGNFKAVSDACQTHLEAMSKFDTVTLAAILTDKAQYIGTDPSEMLNKQQIITYMHKAAKPNRKPMVLILTNRSINFLSDSAALVTEHLINESISKNIQTRITSHLSKYEGKWLFNYVCWSLAPKNEDLKVLDSAVVGK